LGIHFFLWWANQSDSLQKKKKQESMGHLINMKLGCDCLKGLIFQGKISKFSQEKLGIILFYFYFEFATFRLCVPIDN
jgi:hypothetical protein